MKFLKKLFNRFTKVSMGVLSLTAILGLLSIGVYAFASVNITTDAASGITTTDATLNGTNGSTAAVGHSFWVSTSTFDTSSSTIPEGVSSTIDLGPIGASTAFSAPLSSVAGITEITPSTTYFFAAWSNVGGTWYPGDVLSFTTALPGSLAAQDFGVWNSGGVNGYSAGFGLTDATLADANSMIVELYSGTTLLQTNTSTGQLGIDYSTATSFSSPFDVLGSFDYTADGYWTNVRGSEYGINLVPTKVIATVTLANGKVVTAENTNLTGDTTTIVLPGTLSAEDFGVNSNIGLGTVNGYATGFGVADNTLTGATSVVVKLYAAGDVLLQTNTAILATFNADVTGTQFSSPFDVSGTFDYVTDGYWTNVREAEYGQSVPATKVIATVTLANGKVVTATNTNMVGDATTIYPPVSIVYVVTNSATDITNISSTLNGTNGEQVATNEAFWYGTTTPAGPFVPAVGDASSQYPVGWVGAVASTQNLAVNGTFSLSISSLTPSTEYHFVAWSLVDGTWYPGEVLSFTTSAVAPTPSDITVVSENFNTNKGTDYWGATTGYLLGGADTASVASVSVSLYDSANNLLVTNTSKSAAKVNNTLQGPQYSSAFIVKAGTYSTSSTWEFGVWSPKINVMPAKMVVTVTDINGFTYTAENTSFQASEPSHPTWESLFSDTLSVNLGTAGDFAILSETGITNTGSHTTQIVGDIGSSEITAASMNTVYCSEITGTIYGVDAAYVGSGDQDCFAGSSTDKTKVDTAVLDMGTAYTTLAGKTLPDATELYDGDLSGQTISAGLYKWSNNVVINSDVTLSGSADDIWIFQIAGDLNIAAAGSVSSGIKVLLSGGAQASNIYWQVGGETGATLGTYSTFNGNILTAKQIIMETGAVLNGKALAQTQVTLDANSINITESVDIFTLTYTAGANGTITGDLSQTVNSGADGTTVTAVANSGYHFVNWTGTTTSTTNPRTDTNVLINISVTANFASNSSGGGSSSGSYRAIPAVPANVEIPDGCAPGNKFSTTTGRNCNAATPAIPAGQVLGASIGPIPGCGNRTTGFSVVTGGSCVGNFNGQVLGSSHFNFTKFMKQGSKGNEVMEFQKFLTNAGYESGAWDGKFGPKTKAATLKFQIANNLKSDGIVGPHTRNILNR